MGDAVMTTAILDRILHKCEIFNIDADSWNRRLAINTKKLTETRMEIP